MPAVFGANPAESLTPSGLKQLAVWQQFYPRPAYLESLQSSLNRLRPLGLSNSQKTRLLKRFEDSVGDPKSEQPIAAIRVTECGLSKATCFRLFSVELLKPSGRKRFRLDCSDSK